jgi:hypothetical protein
MANMDEDISGLLDNLSSAAKGNVSERELAVKAEDAWIEKFYEVRKNVIRPMMDKLGKEIQKRDHDYNIVETPFRRDNRAIPDEATIRMDVFLDTERTRTLVGLDRRPHLMFQSHHRSERVHCIVCDITSRGGVVSKIGEFPLEAINEALVKEKFVVLMKRLIAQVAPAEKDRK